MKNWLPKDQRKKILLLSDDLRVTSGVGVMSKEMVEQTAHYFNWVQVGAAVNHPDIGKIIDLSDAVSEATGTKDASVKIYPNNGYGDSRLIRHLIETEKPDAIMYFTDPRYWIWLYQIEHEIRQKMPLMFYAIWDDLPYPFYNENFYRSDDAIFCISKQTYNIVKQVIRKETREPWQLGYIPHGMNPDIFKPISDDNPELVEYRKKLFNDEEVDFVLFYNSRNIRRKMTSDCLLAFDRFMKKLPPEQREKCRYVLHTQPVDEHGTDLIAVIQDVVPDIAPYVVFSADRIESTQLNLLYNIADVTMALSSNEGFGISTCESMVAGTPIIVNVTGGMQDHCGFTNDAGEYLDPEKDFTYEWGSNHDGRFKNHGEWVKPIWPVSLSLQGSPLTPYIFDDRADWKEAADKISEWHSMTREERKAAGLKGREYALGPGMFDTKKVGELFIEHIDNVFANWKPRKRFDLLKV